MFCPQCRTEYLPGFTMCADCGMPLVPVLPPIPIAGREAPLNLIIVYESFSLPEIAIARSILDEAGIEYVLNSFIDGTFWGHAGRQIKVIGSDAPRARSLLAELEKGNPISEENEFGEDGESADRELQ